MPRKKGQKRVTGNKQGAEDDKLPFAELVAAGDASQQTTVGAAAAPEVEVKLAEKAVDPPKSEKNGDRTRLKKTKGKKDGNAVAPDPQSEQEVLAAQVPEGEMRPVRKKNGQKDKMAGEPDLSKVSSSADVSKQEVPRLMSLAQQVSGDTGLKPPIRKDFGKRGRPIQLAANHFLVSFNTSATIHHYDVEILPEMKANKRFKREIIEAVVGNYAMVFGRVKCVFDGEKNLYANLEIPHIDFRETLFNISMDKENEKERPFTVGIKKVAEISLKDLQGFLKGQIRDVPQHALQALDIVLRHLPSLKYVSIGRSLYPDQAHGYDLGGGAEMWRGYYQSVRPGKWKDLLQLNLDVSNRSFYKAQPALDFAVEFFRCRNVDELYSQPPRKWQSLAKELKGVRIQVVHNPSARRKYRLIGLGKPASEHSFEVEKDGKKAFYTTEKYFLTAYNYRLRHAGLPTLQAQPAEKNTFLPMEVCTILAGQQSKKLTDLQTSNMIRKTALPAPERRDEIMKLVKAANLNQDSFVQGFGISIVTEMMRVTGRVLPPPLVLLKDNKEIRPRDGVWDLTGSQLYDGAVIKAWGLIVHADCRTRPDQIEWFWKELVKTGSEIGVSMAAPVFNKRFAPRGDVTSEFAAWKKLQLVVVVLPFANMPFYGEVKRNGDILLGVTTQCILTNTIEKRCNRATLINLLLKINAKMGKTNSILSPNRTYPRSSVFSTPVIILGADVTHPAPGETKRPSIAAVVGSMDQHAQRYLAKICVQDTRKEVICTLKDKVRELLIEFKRATNFKPARIIFYRDGVGEGQFYEVLRNELLAIRAACTSLERAYQPSITFLVVQKRHHTRLFCENLGDAVGRSKNVPPGTVVDTAIVHPSENDFFLCSHQGIQGTSRPTHYHVLWDDSDFSADDLHQLTYELCHTYVRCPRSVSIPAPAYYAHLAAFRARKHLEQLQEKMDNSGVELEHLIQQMEKAVLLHDDASRMYFV